MTSRLPLAPHTLYRSSAKEESRTALRSLQENKKAWFEARRQKRRWRCPHEEQRRTQDNPGHTQAEGNCSDVDDQRRALAIVDNIVKAASTEVEAETESAATEAVAVAAAAAEAEATFSHATSLLSPSVARASSLTAPPRRMGDSSRRLATAATVPPVPASAVPARANGSAEGCRGSSSSSSCAELPTETLCRKAEGLLINLDGPGPRSGVGKFFVSTRGSRGQGVEEQDEDEL